MPALSLAPRALYLDVAEQLRQRIYSRELAPGSWVDELKLAKEYGISRTPLREALKVLATEGLVTMKVRRGAYVTEVSEKDLREVYHLMALLEADAARQVAANAGADELNELLLLHHRLEEAGAPTEPDPGLLFRLNEQFHMRLLEMADNRWATQMVADLRKVMKLNRQHSLLRPGCAGQLLAEHRAVMDAISARDPEAAQERMRAHFRNGLEAAT